MNNLYVYSQTYRDMPLHIIPTYEAGIEKWLSPWDALNSGLHDEERKIQLLSLSDMFLALNIDRQHEFDLSVKRFKKSVTKVVDQNKPKVLNRIPLELKYNQLKLFFYAKVVYFLRLFSFCCR